MTEDEWRVEVELDDEQHGFSLGERMRATNFDGVVRRRLGRRMIVTRDGSRLFAYADEEERAHEAARLLGDLIAAEELTGSVRVTRWHPVEEAWKDASAPMPRTPEELEAERDRHEQAEAREAEDEGESDWLVRVEAPSRAKAIELEHRLEDVGVPVSRRWSYLLAGALTEDDANELGERVRAMAPEGSDVSVEVNPSDLPTPLFVFVGAMLDRGRPANR